MCFCASASFIAGAFLLVVGAIALRKTRSSSAIMFASIPLFFGLQQIAEGFVWLTADMATYYPWHTIAKVGFLFFAFIIWPTWIPLSLYKLESNSFRKKILFFFICYGLFISSSLLAALIWYGPVTHIEQHISYQILPEEIFSLPVLIVLYATSTVAPFFVASSTLAWFLGTCFLISALISYYVFTRYFVSVWCFFAALISIFIAAFPYNKK